MVKDRVRLHVNMSVEDVLDELGGYGTVTLRKIKFPVNASHMNGTPRHPEEKWVLEISLEGYNNKYGTWRDTVEGTSIREVVENGYAMLETYIFSTKAKEDRERYVQQFNFYKKRYDEADTYSRMGHDPIRPPTNFKPEIIWGQPRSWKDVT